MTLYEELKARGLVAQITDEEIIDLINNGKATFYIGFDCTADSLTAAGSIWPPRSFSKTMNFASATLQQHLHFSVPDDQAC